MYIITKDRKTIVNAEKINIQKLGDEFCICCNGESVASFREEIKAQMYMNTIWMQITAGARHFSFQER